MAPSLRERAWTRPSGLWKYHKSAEWMAVDSHLAQDGERFTRTRWQGEHDVYLVHDLPFHDHIQNDLHDIEALGSSSHELAAFRPNFQFLGHIYPHTVLCLPCMGFLSKYSLWQRVRSLLWRSQLADFNHLAGTERLYLPRLDVQERAKCYSYALHILHHNSDVLPGLDLRLASHHCLQRNRHYPLETKT